MSFITRGFTGKGRDRDPRLPPGQSLVEDWPVPLEIERSHVCGPTPFVEAVAIWLIELGHSPGTIRTERFGA